MGRITGSGVILFVVVFALGAGVANAAPSPGRYEVGVSNIIFTKTSESTGQPRPLDTVIWYPAVADTGTPEALGRRDADVQPKRFPWIVFSHGSCGRPRESSYLTMELARRGYVVVAPAHIGNTADDPNCGGNFADSLGNRVPDVRFIIDSMLAETANPSSRFADRLRPDRIGMAGLSAGAYTTLVAVLREPRLRAAAALVVGGADFLGQDDITVPTLIIGGERDIVVGFAESEKAYARVAAPRFLVKLLAANHLAVTNECFPLCGPNDIPQAIAHRIVTRYVLTFFRYYLVLGRSGGAGSIRPMPRAELTADPYRRSPAVAAIRRRVHALP